MVKISRPHTLFFTQPSGASGLALFFLFALLLGGLGHVPPAKAEPTSDKRLANHAITWQMLPGETLNGLAALFYKDDRAMQQRFVAATLALNRGQQPIAGGKAVFTNTSQILIPDLKYLSAQSAPRKHPKPAVSTPMPVSTAQPSTAIADSVVGSLDMMAQYESLVKLNAQLKIELERLNDRLRQLQALMQDLLVKLQTLLAQEKVALPPPVDAIAKAGGGEKIAAPQSLTQLEATPHVAASPDISAPAANKPEPTAVPADAAQKQFKQVEPAANTTSSKSVTAMPAAEHNNDLLKIIIPLLLTLVAIGSLVLIYRWRINPLSQSTILQQPSLQPGFRPTTQRGTTVQSSPDASAEGLKTANEPVTLPPTQQIAQVPLLPTRDLLAKARLLMAENNADAALSMLRAYVEAYPEQSILPWLHVLEIHHNMQHRKSFSQLADRMHDTFSEEIAAWNDAETGMSVESNAADYQHIQDELEQIWLNDRAAFSTEVLKEIVVLQEVLKTRSNPVPQELVS